MNAMITRREFTRTLGSAAALAAFTPVLNWAADETKKVSPDAAKIYRDSFILDGNAFAGIGGLLGQSNLDEIAKLIRDSGVNALKATLGGAIGNFEMAVAEIASASSIPSSRPTCSRTKSIGSKCFADWVCV